MNDGSFVSLKLITSDKSSCERFQSGHIDPAKGFIAGTHDVYATSYERRCNVMTLMRRCIRVICLLVLFMVYYLMPWTYDTPAG